MPKVDNKTVREKCNKMNDAWFEGAESATFNGITQADFQTEVEACAANDAEIADLRAELNMKIDARDDAYVTRGRQTLPVEARASPATPPTATTAPCTAPWASSR